MARTKSFNEAQVLESAMLLFWKNGYSATSMKDLERVMKLKPTSIYNAFGSKRELFEKSLNLYLDTVLTRFIESLANAESTEDALRDVLNGVIYLHFNKSHPGGCLIVLSLLESEQHNAQTKTILDSAIRILRDKIIERLEQGQVEGEVKHALDIKVFANHITALITGMIALAKAGISKKELQELIENSSHILLHSILK